MIEVWRQQQGASTFVVGISTAGARGARLAHKARGANASSNLTSQRTTRRGTVRNFVTRARPAPTASVDRRLHNNKQIVAVGQTGQRLPI
jgi:hypothetical protein